VSVRENSLWWDYMGAPAVEVQMLPVFWRRSFRKLTMPAAVQMVMNGSSRMDWPRATWQNV